MVPEAQYICFNMIILAIQFLLFKNKGLLLIKRLKGSVAVVLKVWYLNQGINLTGNLLEQVLANFLGLILGLFEILICKMKMINDRTLLREINYIMHVIYLA